MWFKPTPFDAPSIAGYAIHIVSDYICNTNNYGVRTLIEARLILLVVDRFFLLRDLDHHIYLS